MNDARWPDAMAVDSLGGTGASPARAVKFKFVVSETRSHEFVTDSGPSQRPYRGGYATKARNRYFRYR